MGLVLGTDPIGEKQPFAGLDVTGVRLADEKTWSSGIIRADGFNCSIHTADSSTARSINTSLHPQPKYEVG